MPFRVSCQCGQQFMAQDHLEGTTVRCPSCGRGLTVSRPEPRAQASAAPSRSIPVTCLCGRSYQVAADFAGREMQCKACGSVLRLPMPGAVSSSSDSVGDLFNASTASQPAPRSRPVLPSGYRTADQQSTALLRNIGVGAGVLVGLVALLGIGYVVFSSAMRMVARTEPDLTVVAAPEESSTPKPGWRPPWLEQRDRRPGQSTSTLANGDESAVGQYGRGRPPETELSAESSVYEPGSSPRSPEVSAADVATAKAYPDATGRDGGDPRVAPGGSATTTQTGGTAGSLPSGLIQWFEEPETRRAGLRRVGTAGVPYAHYSWMCQLLPYVGHEDLYNQFDFSKPLIDDKNLQLTGVIVPEFQNATDDRRLYEGYPFKGMALTHFVGMSGVEDGRNVVAASLPRADPRAGVFGYDDVASSDEITDGASNTVMILGSGELASPWALGGGGTVRGAREPYFDPLSGFGSRGRKSPGALAVMADGSVRFISADIQPSAFRAMSTIHGGETIDISPWVQSEDWGR